MRTHVLGLVFLAVWISPAGPLFAQHASFAVQPRLSGLPLELGKTVFLPSLGDSVRVDTWRCLLSSVRFLKEGRVVGEGSDPHWLLDAEDPGSLEIRGRVSERPDAVRFLFGVDSLTSVSGVYGGALDPTRGMYWTWQSGYIFLKLEGWSPAAPGRKGEFHFHVGGYAGVYRAQREVTVPLAQEGDGLILFDIDPLLESAGLETGAGIMSPGERAARMADRIAQAFHRGG